jgi:hypothetical protein
MQPAKCHVTTLISRCDNGTNFHGVDKELKAMNETDGAKISDYLLRHNIQWIFGASEHFTEIA